MSMLYRATSSALGAALRAAAPLSGPDWHERLALRGPQPAPGGIWLHAASVGEVTSARAIAEALGRDFPLTVTTNTPAARDLVRGWGMAACLAPLDVPGAVARLVARLRPALAITVEAELWPNRAAALARAGVAQAMIGARLSARSAARWGRLPGLIGPVLAEIDAASAQDADSEARLLALGLPAHVLIGRVNLKLIGPRAVVPPPASPRRDTTLLIASSHADEEAPLLAALRDFRARAPDARVIWAPRHPDRFDAIARALPDFARRSAGADADAPLLLADSMGEMAQWYRAAGIALLAGSFGAAGGHSPWEAAGQTCAILYGPHVSSAPADYAALAAAGGARMTRDWARDAAALLADPACARQMGRAARAVLEAQAGDPAPLLARLHTLASMAPAADMIGSNEQRMPR